MAQPTQTILLASATAARLNPLRAISAFIHTSLVFLGGRLATTFIFVNAPI